MPAMSLITLAHLSTRLKSSVMSCTSCVAIFSSTFLSLMPCRNETTIEAFVMRGMVFQT
jgi:hypothetical protein